MAENFGSGVLGGVVLVDPATGLPYKATGGGGGGGAVDSVNGMTGEVVLEASDIPGSFSLSHLPAGSVFVVRWDADHWEDMDGNTLDARPSNRVDIVMQCITSGATPPDFAIDGVDMLLRVGS